MATKRSRPKQTLTFSQQTRALPAPPPLTDMSAKNVIFFGRLPLESRQLKKRCRVADIFLKGGGPFSVTLDSVGSLNIHTFFHLTVFRKSTGGGSDQLRKPALFSIDVVLYVDTIFSSFSMYFFSETLQPLVCI